MRTFTLLALLPALLLAACDDVPTVSDPHRVVVRGQPMTQVAFLQRYCQGQDLHPTCAKVAQAMLQDASHGKMVAGW